MRILIVLAVLVLPLAAVADEPGFLLLERHDIAERDGAQAADLFVYGEDGRPHPGRSGGQYPAGEYVELAPGWYFVEVGRFRAPANAVKVFVESGRVTVVPSGWVSVRTPPVSAQPTVGCAQWNAELNAFVETADGTTALVNSNRGAGVQRWGAIQLIAGDHRVYFNDVPTTFTVVDGRVRELPTGFQDPVYGIRPQLSNAPDGDPSGLRLPLCEDGALQVPAGTYWASGAVPLEVYPYERRDWNQVTVPAESEPEDAAVRAPRLSHPRYEGAGASPQQLSDDERQRITGTSTGGGIRLNGFGN